MRVNKEKNANNVYPVSAKGRTLNPKYEGTKIFTLKDIMKEVDEVDNKKQGKLISKNNTFNMNDFAAHEFINNDANSYEFDELKHLTLKASTSHKDHIKVIEATPDAKSKNKKQIDVKKVKTEQSVKYQGSKEPTYSGEKDKPDRIKSVKDFEDRNKHFEERRKAKQKKLEEEMKKVCSFKPNINKKSAILDKQRNNSPNKVPRQENLYELNAVLQERREELKEIIEMERYEKYGALEQKECTFRPKINDAKLPVDIQNKNISERNQLWERKKKEKIQKISENHKDKELVGCTFKPQINKDS